MPPVGFRRRVEAALPGTTREIADKTGLSKTTVQEWIGRMRKEGVCRISKWNRQLENGKGGGYAPTYVLGSGEDAPYPPRLPLAETARRHIAKLKKSDQYDTYRARIRARHTVKLALEGKIVCPMQAALFGISPKTTRKAIR